MKHQHAPALAFEIQRRWESLERHGLSRAQSLRIHGSSVGEEGMKRVSSAPQLGDQEKGSLLKRKLSVSDIEPSVVDRASSKYKKQGQRTLISRVSKWFPVSNLQELTVNGLFLISGVAKSSIQQLAKEKTCKKVSKDLLDPSDFECALCMRYHHTHTHTHATSSAACTYSNCSY